MDNDICFIMNGHDYSDYLEEDGLHPVDNNVEAEGSGRNLLDAEMYIIRIATKEKWSVKFLELPASVMSQLLNDLPEKNAFVSITMLDAKSNRHLTKDYYTSTIDKGLQRKRNGKVVYEGCNFEITQK